MLLVGLTGGLGSGKSTVARLLERRGAVVVDADELARRAVEPGTPGYRRVVQEFGPEVLTAEGRIDRDRLAGVVFADPGARRRLEAIVHPEVARLFAEAVAPFRESDRVVVYVVPLLVETGLQEAFDEVVVVSAPEEVRLARVMTERGMSEADARARMRAQVPEEDRLRAAGHVVPNDGTLEDLERRVDRLWAALVSRGERQAR